MMFVAAVGSDLIACVQRQAEKGVSSDVILFGRNPVDSSVFIRWDLVKDLNVHLQVSRQCLIIDDPTDKSILFLVNLAYRLGERRLRTLHIKETRRRRRRLMVVRHQKISSLDENVFFR